MIISKTDIATASAKTKRAIRYEYELEHIALRECVFAANNTREFKLLMEAKVLADARFDRIGIMRQAQVDSYVRGCLDTLAMMQGLQLAEAPDDVRPKPRHASTFPPAKRPSARPRVTTLGNSPGHSFPQVWAPLSGLRMAARKPEGEAP